MKFPGVFIFLSIFLVSIQLGHGQNLEIQFPQINDEMPSTLFDWEQRTIFQVINSGSNTLNNMTVQLSLNSDVYGSEVARCVINNVKIESQIQTRFSGQELKSGSFNVEPIFSSAMRGTYSLPPGKYELCVRITGEGIEPSEECKSFSNSRPEQAILLYPGENEIVEPNTDLQFIWNLDSKTEFIAYQYRLKIFPIYEGELIQMASETHIPLYNQIVRTKSFSINPNELGLERYPGLRKIGWQIQLLDYNGNPVGINEGKSELRAIQFNAPVPQDPNTPDWYINPPGDSLSIFIPYSFISTQKTFDGTLDETAFNPLLQQAKEMMKDICDSLRAEDHSFKMQQQVDVLIHLLNSRIKILKEKIRASKIKIVPEGDGWKVYVLLELPKKTVAAMAVRQVDELADDLPNVEDSKVITKIENSRPATNEFPWPPPTPTDEMQINDKIIKRNENLTLGNIKDRIEDSLKKAGYNQFRYAAIDKGFVIITCMEQIMEDGSSLTNTEKCLLSLSPPISDNFFTTIRRMFFPEIGYYRFFVFSVSPGYSENKVTVGWEDVNAWGKGGDIPAQISNLKFGENYRCKALLYEFKHFHTNKEPDIVKNSKFSISTLLERAGIWKAQ